MVQHVVVLVSVTFFVFSQWHIEGSSVVVLPCTLPVISPVVVVISVIFSKCAFCAEPSCPFVYERHYCFTLVTTLQVASDVLEPWQFRQVSVKQSVTGSVHPSCNFHQIDSRVFNCKHCDSESRIFTCDFCCYVVWCCSSQQRACDCDHLLNIAHRRSV